MLRWFAALSNAGRAPATMVALGDSLLGTGNLHPAIERIVRHYNPRRFDTLFTGHGWHGGDRFQGDGTVAEEGGFDGRPRHLRDGEVCEVHRLLSTSVDLFGEGRVEVSQGDDRQVLELSVAEPRSVVVRDPAAGALPLVVRARGPVVLDGAFVAADNEQRGLRYYEIVNPGKTFDYFLRETRAIEYLGTIDPDLLLLVLGVNDLRQGGVDRFRAGLEAMVGQVRTTLPRTSICYWVPHRAKLFPLADWQQVRPIVDRVSASFGVKVIDGHALLGSTSPEDDTEDVTFDGVHYTEVGRRLMSEAVLSVIAPGLAYAPGALTTAQLELGRFYAGTGKGEADLVRPPTDRYNVLLGGPPNVFAPTGLYFSEALYLSAIEPPRVPLPDAAAIFVRSGPDGNAQLCVRLPDGSVRVLAFEDSRDGAAREPNPQID